MNRDLFRAPLPTVAQSRNWPMLLLAASLLSGCYIPTNGIREPNPGPTASPPWPYQDAVMPPGGGAPTMNSAVPSTPVPQPYAYGGQMQPPYPAAVYPQVPQGYQKPGDTAPPPSASIPPQYADWLFDGLDGRGFSWYLADGYRRYAKHEDNAHDFEDAAKFLARAGAVERGERVEPESLQMRILPAYAVDDLLYARQRLMRAFHAGAAQRLPKIAANAQVAFDCWMEQQEENTQPHDVARCRRDFEAFIVRLEPRPDAPSAPCPPPVPACTPLTQLVFFELDRNALTPAARETIASVAEHARAAAAGTLIITAHADRAGGDRHNESLSKRRLDTVVESLVAAGLQRERIVRAEYHGERQARVPTADGVRQAENRRVELRLSCNSPAHSPCAAASATPAGGHACAGPVSCPMQVMPQR